MNTNTQSEVQFGKVETVKVLDNEGSRVTTEENIVAGKINSPVRKRYEIKTRVHGQREEHEAYMRFSDDMMKNAKTKLDPAFKLERTRIGDANGYYYAVSCYTQLEY